MTRPHLWPRGFLVAARPRRDLPLPDGFAAREVGPGLWVACDERATLHTAAAPGACVAVLGLIADPERPEASGDDLARALAARLTDGARASFAAVERDLDRYVGRYAIAAATLHGSALWTDASGQRAVYKAVDASGWVASSHAALLADLLGRPRCPRVAAFVRSDGFRAWRGSKPLPGLVTPWRDVEIVPPSQRLDLSDGTLTRIRLHAPIEPVTLERATEIVLHDMRGAGRAFARRSPLALSLTGGVDSRTTLACLRPVAREIECFTYHRDNDVAVAKAIAAALGLRHIELRRSMVSQRTREAWSLALARASWIGHGPALPAHYLARLRPGSVHLRSAYGQGRGFYRLRHGRNVEGRTAHDLAHAYMGLGGDPFVLAAFERFVEATGWHEQRAIDPLEALYLEHRVPQFHALAMAESDFVIDAASLFNGWRVHEALLGYSVGREGARGRDAADVCRAVTRAAWPELAAIPYGIGAAERTVGT